MGYPGLALGTTLASLLNAGALLVLLHRRLGGIDDTPGEFDELARQVDEAGLPRDVKDKATGERLGQVELPALPRYGMMTYMHEGQQYMVVQLQNPGRLVALRLP